MHSQDTASGYWARAESPFILASLTIRREPREGHQPVEYSVFVAPEVSRVGHVVCSCGEVHMARWTAGTESFLGMLEHAWVNSPCASESA